MKKETIEKVAYNGTMFAMVYGAMEVARYQAMRYVYRMMDIYDHKLVIEELDRMIELHKSGSLPLRMLNFTRVKELEHIKNLLTK